MLQIGSWFLAYNTDNDKILQLYITYCLILILDLVVYEVIIHILHVKISIELAQQDEEDVGITFFCKHFLNLLVYEKIKENLYDD
jgi:hypothetical protein